MTESSETTPVEPSEKPQYVAPPEDPELKAIWDEYLQKCCDVGHLDALIRGAENETTQLEKRLDVARQARNKLRVKYNEMSAAKQPKLAKAN